MISYELFKEIELYATRHAESSSSYYLKSGRSQNQIMLNCLNGKIAEYCCYFSMIKAGYIIKNEPDLKITQEKSHDPDLICIGKNKIIYQEEKNIHVKSILVSNFEKYGASFLVSKSDPMVINPTDQDFYSVMLQENLLSYRFFSWIPSKSAKYTQPATNLPNNLAVHII